MSHENIMDLLDTLVEDTNDEVTVDDVVANFKERGFGPLILIPALIALLPTGAIPGVPTVCGITLFLVCIQIAGGRSHPWLPTRLRNRSISHDKLVKAADKARPYVKKLESLFHPRFTKLTESPAKNVVAFYCGVVALCMIPLEAMPFAAALPAFALCITAIGITNCDGLVMTIGLVLQASTGILLFQVIGML